MTSAPVIAIDGPSGVGKSTAARLLAERLGVPLLDTGAMYRAVGLRALEVGLRLDDEAAVASLATDLDLSLEVIGSRVDVLLEGEPVGERIRTPEVSEAASRVATLSAVRKRLVELQRDFAARYGGVLEGRDIGTVVFPDTPFKFFLEARPEVRYERRYQQLLAAGKKVSYDAMVQEIGERDERDRGREMSPLQCDESYLYVDTSDVGLEEVVETMCSAIEVDSSAE